MTAKSEDVRYGACGLCGATRPLDEMEHAKRDGSLLICQDEIRCEQDAEELR